MAGKNVVFSSKHFIYIYTHTHNFCEGYIDIAHPLVHSAKCLQYLGLHKANASSGELNPDVSCDWQEPNHLSQHCLLLVCTAGDNWKRELRGTQLRFSNMGCGYLKRHLIHHPQHLL